MNSVTWWTFGDKNTQIAGSILSIKNRQKTRARLDYFLISKNSTEIIKTSEPTCEEYAEAEFDISNTLLHDIILLEVRAFVMKYEATKRRREKGKNNLESKIDKIQNSLVEEDIEQLNNMKMEL